jgi:hypothetical protein
MFLIWKDSSLGLCLLLQVPSLLGCCGASITRPPICLPSSHTVNVIFFHLLAQNLPTWPVLASQLPSGNDDHKHGFQTFHFLAGPNKIPCFRSSLSLGRYHPLVRVRYLSVQLTLMLVALSSWCILFAIQSPHLSRRRSSNSRPTFVSDAFRRSADIISVHG